MIDDWVMYNPNVFIEDEYESVKEWFPTQINSGEDIDLAIEGCYAPIPLTTDILEKNGFESQHNVGYVLEHYDDNTIIVDLYNHTLKILINYKVVFEKEYFDIIPLHEFQHALKLCGIKKEIEICLI